MPDIDPIILQLRAEVRQYQNEIRATTTLVSNQLDRQERSILDLEHQVESSSHRIGGAFSSMGQRIAAFASGIALGTVVREMIGLADQAKQLEAQLRLATDGFGNFTQAQADVQRIADTTRGSLEATSKLYGGFVRAARETGRSQDDAARATQTFAEALKIGGASTEEAASATLQFNQALQSGVLRGDEFNSIMEASPRIARLLADALGVPIGQLRKMAEEGKITSDVLFRALTDRQFTAGIDAEFSKLPKTFGDAMQAIENAAITTFGEFDKGGQFSNALVSILGVGTDTFKGLTSEARQFGVDARAIFDGLGTLFDPIKDNAEQVFDFINLKVFSVREQIASLLGSIDRVSNFDTNIENAFKNGLNRAIQRSGGTVFFKPSPVSDLRGQFLSRNDRTRLRSQEAEAEAKITDRFGGIEALGRFVKDPSKYSIFGTADGRIKPASAPPSTGGGGSKGRSRVGGKSDAEKEAERANKEYRDFIADLKRDLLSLKPTEAVSQAEERRRAQDLSERNFKNVFGREGTDYDDPFAGVGEYDKQRGIIFDGMEDAERNAQIVREDNVRSLANLYEDLFTQGSARAWDNFKRDGLRTLAIVLAQATIASFTKGGGGFGSLLGNVLNGAKSAFGGGGTFGRASGGYVAPGQTVRVNEQGGGVELLRMGSQGGTVIPLGQAVAAPRASTTIVNQTFTLDARYGVTTPELLRHVNQVAKTESTRAAGASFAASQRAAPGTYAQYQNLEG